MKITDIEHWYVDAGIGHIAVSERNGWVSTACLQHCTGNTTTERPKRICRACRAALNLLSKPKQITGKEADNAVS